MHCIFKQERCCQVKLREKRNIQTKYRDGKEWRIGGRTCHKGSASGPSFLPASQARVATAVGTLQHKKCIQVARLRLTLQTCAVTLFSCMCFSLVSTLSSGFYIMFCQGAWHVYRLHILQKHQGALPLGNISAGVDGRVVGNCILQSIGGHRH